jgi:hypothetical protein
VAGVLAKHAFDLGYTVWPEMLDAAHDACSGGLSVVAKEPDPVTATVMAFGWLAANKSMTLEQAEEAFQQAFYIGAEQAQTRLEAALKVAKDKAMSIGEAKDLVLKVFWE